MNNPLIYLFQKMWTYSAGNRRNVVLYIVLSICAALLFALEPLVVGLFLNTLQTEGVTTEAVPHLLFILSLLFFLELGFWALHGPSRVIELRNAFLSEEITKIIF